MTVKNALTHDAAFWVMNLKVALPLSVKKKKKFLQLCKTPVTNLFSIKCR